MSSGELTCLEFVELITDYLEGVLERSSASRVTEHLVRCEWCMRYLDQMNATVAALKMLPPEPVPDALCAAIAAALDSGASSKGHCDL
jgi:predicted anti-sigma-YlaC factor YlaD